MSSIKLGRPRPVLTAAGISGLVTSLAGIAAWLGYTTTATSLSGLAETLGSVAITVLSLVSHAVTALRSEPKVTPVSDPRDNNGVSLVPVTAVLNAATVGMSAGTAATASGPLGEPVYAAEPSESAAPTLAPELSAPTAPVATETTSAPVSTESVSATGGTADTPPTTA